MGTRRITSLEYSSLAHTLGFEWQGPFVEFASEKTGWRCTSGHVWLSSYSMVKRTRKCPRCSVIARNVGLRNKDQKFISLASKKSLQWIGPLVNNRHEKTGWLCQCGLKFDASYGQIYGGSGCPKCALENAREIRRKKPDDYRNLAVEHGFIWLGTETESAQSPTQWQCAFGHVWSAPYARLNQGIGCPRCGKASMASKKRRSETDYHSLARTKGYEWLGPTATHRHQVTFWRCKLSHEFESSFARLSGGNGCPTCGKKKAADGRRRKPEDYSSLAEQRGFVWHGPEVASVLAQTSWRCSEGHVFSSTFNRIDQGARCSVCNPRKSPARSKVDYRAKADARRLRESDYHGMAESRGFKWLGPAVLKAQQKTEWICSQNHRWWAPYASLQQGRGCKKCASITGATKQSHPPEKYFELAAIRGVSWLGPKVRSVQTKTRWQCACGCTWEAAYASVNSGSGCPKCADQLIGEKKRIKPAQYSELAVDRGLNWIGPTVPTSFTPTGWECVFGHCWLATYNKISSGRGCPECAKSDRVDGLRLTQSDYEETARAHNVQWLGPEVRNSATVTRWRCSRGHEWSALIGSIKQGHGCKKCAIDALRHTEVEYQALARKRGLRWQGPLPTGVEELSVWQCAKNHTWTTTFSSIRDGSGCPICQDLVNGVRVSKPQRKLHELVGGELNFRFGPYCVDVAILWNEQWIAIEYDSWFWHADQQVYDKARDDYLVRNGWFVLRIRSNSLLPELKEIEDALDNCTDKNASVSLTLSDWGVGKTAQDVGSGNVRKES